MSETADGEGVREEFVGAKLGDGRRVSRLIRLASALDEKPEASYPDATMTDAGLEGAYRLLSNEAVTADGILAGHYEQTAERAAAHPWVIAVHDTTIFQFPGEQARRGLGHLRGKGQGFLGHFSLLVAPGELRRPLGVMSMQAVVREKRRAIAKPRPSLGESVRWLRGVELTEERLGGHCKTIHVMDREADSYALWAAMVEAGHGFVIRNRVDRPLSDGDDGKMSEAIAKAA